MPHDASNDFSKNVDMTMLTLFGGKERYNEQLGMLLKQSGFKIDTIIYSKHA